MSEEGRDYILFLEDMVTAIDKIETYSRNLSREEFHANTMAVDAVIGILKLSEKPRRTSRIESKRNIQTSNGRKRQDSGMF